MANNVESQQHQRPQNGFCFRFISAILRQSKPYSYTTESPKTNPISAEYRRFTVPFFTTTCGSNNGSAKRLPPSRLLIRYKWT